MFCACFKWLGVLIKDVEGQMFNWQWEHKSEFSVVKCQAEVQEKYMPVAKAESHYWVLNAY